MAKDKMTMCGCCGAGHFYDQCPVCHPPASTQVDEETRAFPFMMDGKAEPSSGGTRPSESPEELRT
jgi:hypothetical protein